jgi:hypothetical protein
MTSTALQDRTAQLRRLAHRTLAITWIVNALLLVTAFVWVYTDGQSRSMMERLIRKASFQESISFARVYDSLQAGEAIFFLVFAAAIALLTLFAMFGGLFIGGSWFRSMRTWLLFTALVAGWLGFIASWPDVYWSGQQRRVAPVLAEAEKMARYLDAHWPVEDGELAGVGPFLAYPKGAPTVLLPLRWISFPDTDMRFSAVENSIDGTIRFELAGDETGAWLEWRRDELAPGDFTGGLETRYQVGRAQQLAPHWYLVRYNAASSNSDL